MRHPTFYKHKLRSWKGENKRKGRETGGQKQTQQGPSLWWFPYPLIAGTFGPIASAFSICALAMPWRALKLGDEDKALDSYINNPKWQGFNPKLTGINAAQLAVACISNLYLFLNMAGRVRFSIAQSIVIIGWYLSSISLVALTTSLRYALPYEYILTQAYYYAVFSAVLYFLVATMMAITVFGFYKGHYDEEFKLTVRRRSLMIQTSGFLLYLLSGAAVYAHVENWEYLDSVYWADYTILTVGIGDFAPSTHLGRSLLFPFATGGIIIFGLVICTIRSLVVDRGKLKLGTNIMGKLRQKTLRELQKEDKSGKLAPICSNLPGTIWMSEHRCSREEFELMRQIQDRAISQRRWVSFLISAFAWFVLWFVSASIFKAAEKAQSWSYFDSLYFAFTSLLTIGYGDFYPTSSPGKAFFVFWSLLAVPTLTILISNMGDTIVRNINDVILWVGDLTIFATRKRFKTSFKRAAYRMTKAARFKDNTQGTDSGIPNNTSHDSQTIPESDLKAPVFDVQCLSPVVESEAKENTVIRESRKNLLCLLIKEIAKLITHSTSCPSTRYTFDEWLWYVKLLGKSQSDSNLHGVKPGILGEERALPEIVMAGSSDNARQEETGENWCWIGDQSPLMANKGESEWLLERLLNMMEREVRNL
ncbi:hypothetical protein BGZ60DRAFT_568232 [Tricladium varicosporioides]|nr:hypothetical protein BGZ60DRAFT_568232 [Hymenoscyphus varicosporioides]